VLSESSSASPDSDSSEAHGPLDRSASTALTWLTRLAQRRPDQEDLLRSALDGRWSSLAEVALEVATETGDPLGLVLAQNVSLWPDDLVERTLLRCDTERYRDSVPVRELALALLEIHLARVRERWPDPDENQQEEIARLLNNLSCWLQKIGRLEDAIPPILECIQIRRRLERIDTDDLARSLISLASVLSRMGRHEDALEANQEAHQILQNLVAQSPTTSLPADLAGCLDNLGIILSESGRKEEALQATREAVELWRPLVREDFKPSRIADLAGSLSHLSVLLGDLGRPREALEAVQESLELWRRLSEDRVDVYLPDLAVNTNNLAMGLIGL